MLENAMESHQRYFPVRARRTARSTTASSSCTTATRSAPRRSSRGHERVIRARLADAAFFYREDLADAARGSASRELDTIVFQEKLGTLGRQGRAHRGARRRARRARRRRRRARPPYAERAAHLAKADLVTNAVVEFTDAAGRDGPLLRARGGRGRRRSPRRSSSTTGRASPATRCPRRVAGQHRLDRRQARHDLRHLRDRAWRRPARPTRTRCAAAPSACCRCCSTARRAHARRARSRAALAGYDGRARRSTSRRPARAIKEFFVGRLEGCCATAATRTTPSPRCSRRPPTTPPTRLRAARRSRRSARPATTWRTSRSRSRGRRTSRSPSWARPPTARSWVPRSSRSPTRSTRAESDRRRARWSRALRGAARDATRGCAARSTRSSRTCW